MSDTEGDRRQGGAPTVPEVSPSVHLPLRMSAQPDGRSCGPTCLQAVYRYFGHDEDLEELIGGIEQLDTGGTLAVQLGCHALRRGFRAMIHTYNLQLFDPTWLADRETDLRDRLRRQAAVKPDDGRLARATAHYLEFLDRGGTVEHRVLEPGLIHGFLAAGLPVLAGLSATYLCGTTRELPDEDRPDDIRGLPVGHFVVLCGHDVAASTLTVADPWPDPETPDQLHVHSVHRVVAAILLGVLTYDASLLVIQPR